MTRFLNISLTPVLIWTLTLMTLRTEKNNHPHSLLFLVDEVSMECTTIHLTQGNMVLGIWNGCKQLLWD